jgi:hypothetical protein
MRPQVHTRPHVHQEVEIFRIGIASTMACWNSKKWGNKWPWSITG